MNVGLECLYCGHKWEKSFYNMHAAVSENCPKCKDSNLKVKDLSVTKVDYYKGSPPFPNKKKEDKGWPWGMHHIGVDFGIDPNGELTLTK